MIIRCGNWSVSNKFQSKDTKLSEQFQVQSRYYEYVGKIDTFSIYIHDRSHSRQSSKTV